MRLIFRQFKRYYPLVFVAFLINPTMGMAKVVKWYQINVIVFTRLSKTYYDAEHWVTPPPLPESPAWQTLSTVQTTSRDASVTSNLLAFAQLPLSQFQLRSEEARLKNSRHYRVIWVGSWVQTISSTRSAPVYFKGGQWFERSSRNDEGDLSKNPEIQGLLTFKQTNYIQVNANLRLIVPRDQLPSHEFSFFSADSNSYQTFALNQTQRLRPNELHYFDHPLFGMILKITPYTDLETYMPEKNSTEPIAFNTIKSYKIRP